jgi:hypothetical protein
LTSIKQTGLIHVQCREFAKMPHLAPTEMTHSKTRPLERVWHLVRDPVAAWVLFRSYLGFGRPLRQLPIANPAELAGFIESRASFVAQTSLYGYLRTRAGQRYPQLFENASFITAINIAKWQIWLACVSDLTVYAGGLLHRAMPGASARLTPLLLAAVEEVFTRTGVPADAGPEFIAATEDVRRRIAATAWSMIPDDGEAFSESPQALIKWAPIVDQLKTLDEPIVINSVRFRWQEIRRDLRQSLRPEQILQSA